MSQQDLRTEFLNESLPNISDEDKALRENLPSNDYIDIMLYVVWLENKVLQLQNINNLKRTK